MLGDEAAITLPDPRPVPGMRIRRVRIKSVATIAAVFGALGYVTVLGTLVVVWNVAQRLGFVETLEDTLATSLGLESYEIVGQVLFELLLVGVGIAAVLGVLITIVLAFVYNVTCALLGGLAVETAPLRRAKRVFSLRDRKFISVRW